MKTIKDHKQLYIYLLIVCILIVIMMALYPSKADALWGIRLFGKKKTEFNAVKKEENVKKKNTKNTLQTPIKISAGVDQSMSQNISSGGDSINQTNDSQMVTKMFKYATYILGAICLKLLCLFAIYFRLIFKERATNRDLLEKKDKREAELMEQLITLKNKE